jgi:murein L,D-transpeptidase YafK
MLKLALLVLIVAVLVIAVWSQWPGRSLPEGTRADLVVVRKGDRRLELYRGTELLRAYRVSLGGNPVGPKQQEGDSRTPEGRYTLDWRNERSAFHKSLHVSYPLPADKAAAQARGVSPGGLIMVHGMRNGFGYIGRLHRAVDWTDGCIAVTDREIEEIWRVVADGTPIDIQP